MDKDLIFGLNFHKENAIWILKTNKPEQFKNCFKCRKEVSGWRGGYICESVKKIYCKDCEPHITCALHVCEHYCVSRVEKTGE